MPTIAALSADGLGRWRWPTGTTRVTIFADAGHVGMPAASTLADRLNIAQIPWCIQAPLHGDDFNNDLQHGVDLADYQAAGLDATPDGTPAAPSPTTPEELIAAAARLTNPPDMGPLSALLERLGTLRLEPLVERQSLAAVRTATGISVSILEKQLRELRRRHNTIGQGTQALIPPRWLSLLRLDPSGLPERNEANVLTALSLDPAFAGALVFDEFRQQILIIQSLPWDGAASVMPRPWGDPDDVRCAEWLQHHEINVPPATVARSIIAIAGNIRVHPVHNYLTSLIWDGTPRLNAWVVTYLGVADTVLNRAFGSLWMISAVARIMHLRAKADHMLILEGPQGIRKSTALRVLASDAWFTDELAEIGSKDAAQQMRGVWIIEMAELDAISRAEVSRIKAFLTRTADRYRPPYARYVVTIPRQCVFAGSVNSDIYLRDETGNRRFWPIRCGNINLDALRCDRDQLWAEAVAQYNAGASWWLETQELISRANVEQEARNLSDAWDALIERWLRCEKHRVNVGFGYCEVWAEESPPSWCAVDGRVGRRGSRAGDRA